MRKLNLCPGSCEECRFYLDTYVVDPRTPLIKEAHYCLLRLARADFGDHPCPVGIQKDSPK